MTLSIVCWNLCQILCAMVCWIYPLAFQELDMKWPKKEKNLTEKVEEDFAPHFVQECVSHPKNPDEKKPSRYSCISTYGKFASIPVHWVSKLPQRSKCGNHTLSPVVVVEVHDDDYATIMHINRYVLHSFTHRILRNNNVTRDFLPERATCFLFATDR